MPKNPVVPPTPLPANWFETAHPAPGPQRGPGTAAATPPAPSRAGADTGPGPSAATEPARPPHDGWRQTHLGRLLGHAMRRFDERVLQLMAHDAEVPLALSNLAARGQISAAHIHITRHLALGGSRLTDLAVQAGMTKQAMGDLVAQCEAWGLVTRGPDPLDARARQVRFTADGLAWLQAFHDAVAQAESEFRAAVGADVATVVMLGLEAYAS